MRAATTALLAVAALGFGGCGGDGEDPIEQSVKEQERLAAQAATTTTATTPTTTTDAPPGATIQKLVISTDLKKKPEIGKPSGEPPTKLYQRDIVTGKGKAAKTGDSVSVQYVGVSYSTGEQFDASWDRGDPFPFQLGQKMVITGWDEGVVGMKVGGRRMLVIPPDLAYGAQGQGSIGPNETLVFVIDLEKIS
ncbi:MAG TPA: FKBP-type peptidyl-prolyl cis-trans isomerase [Solirubrobacteraceae bacterium]|jgi:peptidylprolyl isomerase|nr:FKBP-type peptidyl-prolyl cis-trans isomerase [Solirubrobacteraceae bacterium]